MPWTVSQNKGHLDVFWVGPDGSIMTHWWDADPVHGPWASHKPFAITPPNTAVPGSHDVAVVSQNKGHLDVFWVGPDGSIMT
ncbi:hypothetical protein ACWEP4_10245, partial [Streptomyces sp. NPDC004227]